MNNCLLISLLLLQAVSVVYAMDPGFEPVENPGLYKLRRNREQIKRDIKWRKFWTPSEAKDLAYMNTPEGKMKAYGETQERAKKEKNEVIPTETTGEWLGRKVLGRTGYKDRLNAQNWYVGYLNQAAEKELADYEKKRQRLQKSVDTLDTDIANMEDRIAEIKAQMRGVPIPYYRSRAPQVPFTQRVKNWFGYK